MLGWDRGVSERSVGTLSNNEMHLTRSAMVLGAALAGDLGVMHTLVRGSLLALRIGGEDHDLF